jgi:hypothetical protein
MRDEKQVRVIYDTNLVCKNAKCWNWTRMTVSALQLIWCGSRAATIMVVSNWEYLNDHKITDEEKKRFHGQIVIYAIILVCWVFAALLSYAVWHVTSQLQEFVDARKLQARGFSVTRLEGPIITPIAQVNNLSNLKDQIVKRKNSPGMGDSTERGSVGGMLSTDRGMINSFRHREPTPPGNGEVFSEGESPDRKRFGKFTEESRFKPIQWGVPEHKDESSPNGFITEAPINKGNNYMVAGQTNDT